MSRYSTRFLAGVISPFILFANSAWSAERTNVRNLDLSTLSNPTIHQSGAIKSTSKKQSALAGALGLGPDSSLSVKSSKSDHRGNTHTRYQQVFKGLPVWGEEVITHRNVNGSYKATGFVVTGLETSQLATIKTFAPKVSETEAVQIAQNSKGHNSVEWHLKNQRSALFIYIENKTPKLVYEVSYFAEPFSAGPMVMMQGFEPTRPYMLIDAESGAVLKEWEGLAHAEIGEGPGGNTKTGQYHFGTDYDYLDVQVDGNNCTMETTNVKTVNLNHGTSGSTAYSYTCPENTFQEINGAYSPLNDAHYFGGVVFDMYNDWLGVPPLTFQLVMRVHYGSNYQNAFWDGSQMTFGDGGSMFYPLVDINVSAHEVAHGFTEQNSSLVYAGQSGGINEAYSDIAGEAAEQYWRGTVDWFVGGDIMKSADGLRYFEDPTLDGSSIGHASDYYNGMDVHYSSGVYNRAFFLISNTPNWTVQKAFEIFSYANMNYWGPNETYNTAACGTLEAAHDLGYNALEVDDAFQTVGVDCGYLPFVDADLDGMDDNWELSFGLDPADPADGALDLDSDGLTNLEEYNLGTQPNSDESDGDGLLDFDEVNTHGTDPAAFDTDGDLMDDGYEIQYGFNPLDAADGALDADNDGYTNAEEYEFGTDPTDASSFPIVNIISFEDSQIPATWSQPNTADAGWEIDNANAQHGTISLRASTITHSQKAQIEFTDEFEANSLSFWFKTSTESNFDYLRVYVDNTQVFSLSGTNDWTEQTLNISEGSHTIRFEYSKDGSVNTGSDTVWIDNIRYIYPDIDQDGMSNSWEDLHGLDKNDPADAQYDNDSDLLVNLQEFLNGTDPNLADTDSDGLSDYQEVHETGTDPTNADGDNDGLTDLEEINLGTNPNSADSDSDGIPDGFEVENGLDPNTNDANLDSDSDGLTNLQEFNYNTNPNLADSDSDSLSDSTEIFTYQTDPNVADSDNDGLDDGQEVLTYNTNPNNADMDSDGLTDGDEVLVHSTNPQSSDTDSDGMPDGWEVTVGLNPVVDDALVDSDSDAWFNIQEYQYGTDPLDQNSKPVLSGEELVLDHFESGWYTETGTHNPGNTNYLTGYETISNQWVELRSFFGFNLPADGMYSGVTLRIEMPGNGFSSNDPSELIRFYEVTSAHADIFNGTNGLASFEDLGSGVIFGEVVVSESDENSIVELQLNQDALTEIHNQLGETFVIGTVLAELRKDMTPEFAFGWSNNDELIQLVLAGNVDSDSDGMSDDWESLHGLDPTDPSDAVLDPDQDGLSNLQEFINGTDPHNSDTDGDGLLDGEEFFTHRTDPANSDSDDDGLNDQEELDQNTDPLNPDSDGDGMGDGYEVEHGLDPASDDSALDLDADGLTNLEEFGYGTNPNNADTDADNLSDPTEINIHGTNPTLADTDSDGLNDDDEILVFNTNPLVPDSDDDGLMDGEEIQSYGTDPLNADSDQDGMPDGWEANYGLNPLLLDERLDNDSDGWTNLNEYHYGTDPTDNLSKPEQLQSQHSFEDGLVPSNWYIPANADAGWEVDSSTAADGIYSLRATQISHNQIAAVEYETYTHGGSFSFWSKISTESCCDRLRVYVDGQQMYSFSGLSDWTERTVDVTDGLHVIKFEYYKDASVNTGADTVWIDLVSVNLPDTDSDGMPDYWESQFGLNPNDGVDAPLDLDSDGLVNLQEYLNGSDPTLADTDGDGLLDGEEFLTHRTDLLNSDSDNDGLNDGDELLNGTDPFDPDGDNDGLLDGFEVEHGLDLNADDSGLDSDSDGLSNLQEQANGTDPNSQDSDSDNLSDSTEVNVHGTNPTAADTDSDGLNDDLELFQFNTDPLIADMDGDQLLDGDELLVYGTDPINSDTDADAMPDGWEVSFGLNPTFMDDLQDFDGDGWFNVQEYRFSTDPTSSLSTPEVQVNESFEAMTLPDNWTIPSNANAGWEVDTADAAHGSQSLKASSITHNQSAIVQVEVLIENEELSFWSRTSTESCCDKLRVYLDGNIIFEQSGIYDWQLNSLPVSNGIHTIQFEYYKDFSVDSQQDTVWIDLVSVGGLDSDEDGIADYWEAQYGLDKFNSSDALLDTDSDGLINLQEFIFGTHPLETDSDEDGLTDGDEVFNHRLIPSDADFEKDGLPDGWEIQYGFDPRVANANEDPDSDGLTNIVEYENGTNPLLTDSDEDGIVDSVELDQGTDPANWDTDSDGVSDSEDAFPVNAAASVDGDNDQMPDRWNSNCDLACQAASGLSLDPMPNNSSNIEKKKKKGGSMYWMLASLFAIAFFGRRRRTLQLG